MDEKYTVKLSVFEGPLELLLQLIEKRKLHISEISLAGITDDYLAYLKRFEEFPLRNAAQFILVASTLVLIKSRALLPMLSLSEEEEEDIEELERRLRLYKHMKELGRYVEEGYGENPIFYREPARTIEPVFSPTTEITVSNMTRLIRDVLQALPRQDAIPQVLVRKVVSLEEMIESLRERINAALTISFNEFTGTKRSKVDVVVGFLAMLELVRRNIITVRQEVHFEDIEMKTAAGR